RRVGRVEIADEIIKSMKGAGYDVRETDPFTEAQKIQILSSGRPPINGRIRSLWESYRDVVLKDFPKPPGIPSDTKPYLQFVEEVYKSDAYHSLSIEGYSVTPELIERVRSGSWRPEENEEDRENRDALAARGYWQAFQVVKKTVEKILKGQ